MLEVMSAGSTELPRGKGDSGMLLSCWDKSSPLIEELERTVNFAERKCGDLMQQLHFYKEYYEKWGQVERVNHLYHKKKAKKSFRETQEFGSSSENEFEKVNQYFYKKIKSKINEMSSEISEANRMMHSKPEAPPEAEEGPTAAANPPSFPLENKACRSEPTMASTPVADSEPEERKVTEKQSSKSVPARNKVSRSNKRDAGPTKRRYSNLQRYKIRSKSLPQGVRRKFGFGGFFEVFEPESTFREKGGSRSKSRTSIKAESSMSIKTRKSLSKSKTRILEQRRTTPKNSRHRLSKADLRHVFRNTKSESDAKKNGRYTTPTTAARKEPNTCKAIVPSNPLPPNLSKANLSFSDNLRTLITKPNALLPFLRHPIPFIPCSSTSKSFNLGLNVQQVLSLIKRKKHSVSLQAIVNNSMQAARSMAEPTVNTLFISQTTTSHSHVTSAICPAREGSEDGFSVITHSRSKCSLLKQVQTIRSQAIEDKSNSSRDPAMEIGSSKPERPEDVWVVDQPDSREVSNVRSRCTCFPSKHCVDYHKVLRQYTGWRMPSGSRADSYLCTKSKLLAIPSQNSIHFPGGGSDGRVELVKVHNDLLNLTRRYSSLQEQISQNCLDDFDANAELDAMESEVALREVEFKDILGFYNQLMVLKEKLRSLRVRSDQSQSAVGQSESQRPKRDPLKPTPSMTLAKVLKKIQGLQDKIKLIDTP